MVQAPLGRANRRKPAAAAIAPWCTSGKECRPFIGRHSFQREIVYLTVHSILHLLGYDHMEEDQKEVMRRREEEILNNFNLNR